MNPSLSSSSATGARDITMVAFGSLILGTVILVDELPPLNTGVEPNQILEYLSDDGVIAAVLLKSWGASAGIIGNKLGRDVTGKKTITLLKELGLAGSFSMTSKYKTPKGISIADKYGNRTYFWERRPEVLDTLYKADLSLITQASILYLDWYDHGYFDKAIATAKANGVPIYLNFEHKHCDEELLGRYGPSTDIIQATTDMAQDNRNPEVVGKRLLNAGASIALVTLAREGCMAFSKEQTIRVYAPELDVVDGNGAGATFSAGYLFGFLNGWGLEESVRFAVAAASLKCTLPGIQSGTVDDIKQLASQLEVSVMDGTP